MKRENLVEHAAEMGDYLLDGPADRWWIRTHPSATRAGWGCSARSNWSRTRRRRRSGARTGPFIKRLNELVTERHLLSRVWDVIHIAPPLVVTREEIDRIVGILDESLTIAEREERHGVSRHAAHP